MILQTAPAAPTLEELLRYAPVPGLLADRVILVTGSLFLVGAIKKAVLEGRLEPGKYELLSETC